MKKGGRYKTSEFTPCLFTDQEEIIHAVAVVHTELVLIHPFREGNGRLAECWRCSWGCRRDCRLLISAA